MMKIVTQFDYLSGVIGECQIQWYLLTQMLNHVDLPKLR